jgi:hypothetical protein
MIGAAGWLLVAILIGLNSSVSQPSVVDKAPEAIVPAQTPFGTIQFVRPKFQSKDFDIRQFGAIEGGTKKCTEAIQKAIAKAAEEGGGRVVVPKGTWLTGAIHLDNNINLYLAKGAELLFSQDPNDYLPAVFSRHEDTECYKFSAFVYANGKHNIGITGEGTLNGQGKPWWSWKKTHQASTERVIEMGNDNLPVIERMFDGTNGNFLRPAFFQPMNCSNVLVEGVTFLYGAFWTITPTYCDTVIVRKVRIKTEGTYGHTPNGDGVDPSSSTNVLIEYCEFDTGDDCIAIKSGRDKDGLRVNRPTENVIVRHCVGLRGHGGVVVGSETSGGVRNIYAHDCRFNGTDRIVRVKTARGRGGILENMWFEHLSADTIQMEAIRINMLYTGQRLPAQPISDATPIIRNLHFSDISCMYGRSFALEILGLPERPVENVVFSNISMKAAKGIHCVDADSMRFSDVNVMPSSWPVAAITDAGDVLFERLKVPEGADPLVEVTGSRSKRILLKGVNTGAAARVLELGSDVTPDAVQVR